MKRAAVALSALLNRVAFHVGLEGGLLLLATVCLGVFSTRFDPAGPWLVVGAMALLAFIALWAPVRAGK